MKLNKDTKILIVGLGVIGGGYAAALTEAGYTVKCITLSQSDIDYALKKKIIAYGTTEAKHEIINEADLIICALYPGVFVEWVREHQHSIKPGALLTDVTGVKTNIVEKVQSILGDNVEFIAAHPMAGRERSGVEYSDPSVFKGANYIVTPTEKNTKEAIDLCCELGNILGFSRISVISPEEHDEMIAFLSQLTHVIAVALMNCNNTEGLEKYTGDSFRDLTRIAKINDKMWSELFLLNRKALLSEIDSFITEMQQFRKMLTDGDTEGMREKMRHSTERRSLFDKPAKQDGIV